MANIPTLGEETNELLRSKFEEVHQLSSEQCVRGRFGYLDKAINSDWCTFRSGAINMLNIQQKLLNK